MTRLVGLLLLASLVACSSSTGPEKLSFEGKSTVSPAVPMDVETVVTVRNIGDKTTRINTSICGHPIQAFTMPERDGIPVWQSYDPALALCALSLNYAILFPGDYFDFRLTGTIPASLPSGLYYLALTVNGKLVPAGQFFK